MTTTFVIEWYSFGFGVLVGCFGFMFLVAIGTLFTDI